MSEVEVRSDRELKRRSRKPAGSGIPIGGQEAGPVEESTQGPRSKKLELSPSTSRKLRALSEQGKDIDVTRRALAILALGSGSKVRHAAEFSGLGLGTVSNLRQRFNEHGLQAVLGLKGKRPKQEDVPFDLAPEERAELDSLYRDERYAEAVRYRALALLETSGASSLDEAPVDATMNKDYLRRTWNGYAVDGLDYIMYARTLASVVRLKAEDRDRLQSASEDARIAWDLRGRARFLVEKSRGHSVQAAAGKARISLHAAATTLDFVADNGVMAILDAPQEKMESVFALKTGPDQAFQINLVPGEEEYLDELAATGGDRGPDASTRVSRARALLAASRGSSDQQAAEASGLNKQQVQRLRRAYCERGLESALTGLKSGPQRGVSLSLSDAEKEYLDQLLSGKSSTETGAVREEDEAARKKALALIEADRDRSDQQAAEASGLNKQQVQRLRRAYYKRGLSSALWGR